MSIEIRPIRTPEESIQIEDLQRVVWPDSETDIVPAHLILTIARNGGVVLGAFDGDRLAGFVLGFLGTDEGTPHRVAAARLKHCSHQLGVLPEYRRSGLAFRLKQAQREAVMRQGIRLVTWTFDPLLSLNAHLNLRRLGAISHLYKREVYGEMRDSLNTGLPSDRLEVEWWVTSNRVESRLNNARPALDLANYLSAGAGKLLSGDLGSDGGLRPEMVTPDWQAGLALVEIPADFLELKRRDMKLAAEWRSASRQVMEAAFEAGYVATDFLHLRGETVPRSYYLLSAGESTLGD